MKIEIERYREINMIKKWRDSSRQDEIGRDKERD